MHGWEDALPETFFAASGTIGVAFYLGSYFLLQAGLIRGSGYLYAAMNLTAATLVLVSLVRDFNVYSAAIQISFITLSLYGIGRIYVSRNAVRFGPDEMAFITAKLPKADKLACRRFFASGAWVDGGEGDVLMEDGKQVSGLYFLASGAAVVEADGTAVATVEGGSYLGEMSVLHDVPASATVRLLGPARMFFIARDALHRIVAKDGDFRLHLENSMNSDTRAKLISANRRLTDAPVADGIGA